MIQDFGTLVISQNAYLYRKQATHASMRALMMSVLFGERQGKIIRNVPGETRYGMIRETHNIPTTNAWVNKLFLRIFLLLLHSYQYQLEPSVSIYFAV